MKDERKGTVAEYVAPEMRSVSEEEVLEEMGPARAYTGTFPFGF